MSKGNAWKRAIGAAIVGNNIAKAWQMEVQARAGLDPRVCPVCGDATEYEWYQGVVWACVCMTSPNDRGRLIFEAAKQAEVNVFDRQDRVSLLEIRSGHGAGEDDGKQGTLVAKFASAKRNPTWQFKESIPLFAKEMPSVPEGLWVWYPKWWPTKALAEYDARRETEIAQQLAEAKAKASELAAKVGNVYQARYCSECGRMTCPGEEANKECEIISPHPSKLLAFWKDRVRDLQEVVDEVEAKKRKSAEKDMQIANALDNQGFWFGYLDIGKVPEGAFWFVPNSAGQGPHPKLVVASKLTIEQLGKLIHSEEPKAEVKDTGRNIEIHTGRPRTWIGKGGAVAKHLGKAVGKFVKIVERERSAVSHTTIPQSQSPAAKSGFGSIRVSSITPSPFSSRAVFSEICSCGGQYGSVEGPVISAGKGQVGTFLKCQSCGKQLAYPFCYLSSITTKDGRSAGSRFSFEGENGVWTGSHDRRKATRDELDQLEKLVELMKLRDKFSGSIEAARRKD